MSELWITGRDGTCATVTGRVPVAAWKKVNPIWWFMNDVEQTVDQAPEYHGPDPSVPNYIGPPWPHWQRWLFWNFIRNPLQNFRCFVLGCQDQNYMVTGRAPVMTVQRDDLKEADGVTPQTGWQWSLIHLRIPRPFVSYSHPRFTFYIGWQPTGFAGFKLVRHKGGK